MALSHDQVNMDGSDDPWYRYKMPALQVKVEGTSKMRKTVLLNVDDVCRKVGRPTEHLITYFGQSLNVSTKIEKAGKAYLTGAHSVADLQSYVLKFIQETVLCQHCKNPETSCKLVGRKKKRHTLVLSCKACQKEHSLASSDRFVKFVMQHLPPDSAHGHAGSSRDAACTRPLDLPVELADASQEARKEKASCPKCGHSTSKAECRKCGTFLKLAIVPALGEEKSSDTVADGLGACAGADLESLVRGFMQTCDGVSKKSAEDLKDWISTRSDLNVKPIENLTIVANAVAAEVCAACNLGTGKLQPNEVAKQAQHTVQTWQPLIEGLYGQVRDDAAATKGIVCALQCLKDSEKMEKITDSAMVGILLCFRDELVDSIDDTDLASACREVPDQSLAMKKFIEFLEADDSEGDS
jgi:translation initiation factor 2 beta subunit (eIF-2beta)/eIF-5